MVLLKNNDLELSGGWEYQGCPGWRKEERRMEDEGFCMSRSNKGILTQPWQQFMLQTFPTPGHVSANRKFRFVRRVLTH